MLLVYNQSLVPGSSASLVNLKFSTVRSETANPWTGLAHFNIDIDVNGDIA